jgi:flavin-binding protein dodecin
VLALRNGFGTARRTDLSVYSDAMAFRERAPGMAMYIAGSGAGSDAGPSGTIRSESLFKGESQVAQKIIDVVGTSKESFAKAAENAVAEAAKTVRGMRWARVAELEMELDGKKIVKYRTTTKIYFDIEK